MKLKIKRPLSVDPSSFRYGIQIAAEVAADYDKYSIHSHLVSECILGKLNILKGKPRKNPAAEAVNVAISRVERKLDSLEGTIRFMTRRSAPRKSTRVGDRYEDSR